MDFTAVMRERGVLTLPKDIRERNDFRSGTQFQVIDLGQGTIVLSRQTNVLGELAVELERALSEAGISLEDLLQGATAERQRLHRERDGE